MQAPDTLTGWIDEPRFSVATRLRLFGVRRAVGCLVCGVVAGAAAWNWMTPLTQTLRLAWAAPVLGLLAGAWIAAMIARVDAVERPS